jgi:hypothetical protein
VGRRRPKNLLLDIEALRRGENYCERHGTMLSRLVEDFLMALPEDRSSQPMSPIVQRIVDSVDYARSRTDAYRDFLYGTDRIERPDGR